MWEARRGGFEPHVIAQPRQRLCAGFPPARQFITLLAPLASESRNGQGPHAAQATTSSYGGSFTGAAL